MICRFANKVMQAGDTLHACLMPPVWLGKVQHGKPGTVEENDCCLIVHTCGPAVCTYEPDLYQQLVMCSCVWMCWGVMSRRWL